MTSYGRKQDRKRVLVESERHISISDLERMKYLEYNGGWNVEYNSDSA